MLSELIALGTLCCGDDRSLRKPEKSREGKTCAAQNGRSSTPESLFASAWLCPPGMGLRRKSPIPTKSVTYLVTFYTGGQSDREAGRKQPFLEKILGQKVIVDYKVGGGGALGWSELVRSQPDGYLMAGSTSPHHPAAHAAADRLHHRPDHPRGPVPAHAPGSGRPENQPLTKPSRNSWPLPRTNRATSASAGPERSPGTTWPPAAGKMTGTKFNYVPFTGARDHGFSGRARQRRLRQLGRSGEILGQPPGARRGSESRFFGFPENSPRLKRQASTWLSPSTAASACRPKRPIIS